MPVLRHSYRRLGSLDSLIPSAAVSLRRRKITGLRVKTHANLGAHLSMLGH